MGFLPSWAQETPALKTKKASTTQAPLGSVIYKQKMGTGTGGDPVGTLVFNSTKSLYYYERKDVVQASKKLEQRSENEYVLDIKDQEGYTVFRDNTAKTLTSRSFIYFISQYVVVEEATPTFSWQITNETKTMANHLVQKATTSFRGRQYTAWFAPDIPVNLGPWKFAGLPGLILQVADQQGEFTFEAASIDLPAKVLTPLIAPTQGRKVIGWEAYRKLVQSSADNWVKSIQARGPGMNAKANLQDWIEVMN